MTAEPVDTIAHSMRRPAPRAVARALAVAGAVAGTKDLVNTPPLDLYPATFVDAVRERTSGLPVDVHVWDEEALAADGCFRPASIDSSGDDERGGTLADVLGHEDRGFESLEAKLVLDVAVGRLSERERQILQWRFVDERTQREIAAAMGISEKHLSQICNGAAMPSAEATVAFCRVLDLPVRMFWTMACNYRLELVLGKKDLTAEMLDTPPR